MKRVVLFLVVAVVATAIANPVKDNEDVAWNQERARTVRAAHPYHVQYHASYRPQRRYEGYYGTLRFGAPSSTYVRPRAYYEQPGISYRWVRRPSGVWNEQLGFNVYGSPIVYSAYHV